MSAERKNHDTNDFIIDRIIGEDERGCECYTEMSKARARDEIAQLRATLAQQAAQLEQAQTAIREARQQLRATQENWREDCLYRADDILSAALGEEAQHAQAQQA